MVRYIGIDPDLEKSGVAVRISNKYTFLTTLTFFDLLRFLESMADATVVIEAGWKNKPSNFHGGASRAIAERISKNVGENHAIAKQIALFCKEKRINYIEAAPRSYKALGPSFVNKQNKVTHDGFVKITGHDAKHTNQEERDAALLIWKYPNNNNL